MTVAENIWNRKPDAIVQYLPKNCRPRGKPTKGSQVNRVGDEVRHSDAGNRIAEPGCSAM